MKKVITKISEISENRKNRKVNTAMNYKLIMQI